MIATMLDVTKMAISLEFWPASLFKHQQNKKGQKCGFFLKGWAWVKL
jgi:hypothetical protein